jgi:predicted secreted Zn-dependent protease
MEYDHSTGRVRFGARVSRYIWLPALTTTVLAGLYLYLASMFVQVASPQPTTAEAHSFSTAASCVPSTFAGPSGIDLTTATNGLTIQLDQVSRYQIYGATADQLRSEVQVCAPGAKGNGGAEFAGETSYTMSWQYDTYVGNSCMIADVKVGMRIGTALPLWQPTRSAVPGLGERWDKFMSSLTTHEAGHASIDKRYAAQLVTDLSSLPPMDCNNVSSIVKSVVNADMMLLNQANDSYDASTDHGASQGAILLSH